MATDSGGSKTADASYYPYGETRASTGSLGTEKKFTGQRLDATGLYYYGARYYDPEIGRFTSADTMGTRLRNPQAINRYSYTINNPLNHVDPDGRDYVFINGWGTTAKNNGEWGPVIMALALAGKIGNNEKILFFDYGDGSNASKDMSCADAAQRLDKLMEGLTDIKVIGFSKGGAVAMEYLAESVERTITLNPELKVVVTVNSPLQGDFFSGGAKFDRNRDGADRLANLPAKLTRPNGTTVGILTVKDEDQLVGHDPIEGIPYRYYGTSGAGIAGKLPFPDPETGDNPAIIAHGEAQRNPAPWIGYAPLPIRLPAPAPYMGAGGAAAGGLIP